MNVPHICPRCNDNFIPTNQQPGVYPGALSRADNKSEICSPCGEDEAMMDFSGGGCQPVAQWPIKKSFF
jgi:hypothetical protein